ncbi:MAG TPA: hypothetical protein VGJ20_30670 [Xanthobacteraceae bacterium]|jgi:hypothetical protein
MSNKVEAKTVVEVIATKKAAATIATSGIGSATYDVGTPKANKGANGGATMPDLIGGVLKARGRLLHCAPHRGGK